jgi:hypothetical protein
MLDDQESLLDHPSMMMMMPHQGENEGNAEMYGTIKREEPGTESNKQHSLQMDLQNS